MRAGVVEAAAEGLRLLQERQVAVELVSAADVVLRGAGWLRERRLRVRVLRQPPTPSRVRLDLAQRPDGLDGVLYLLPRLSASLREVARADVGVDVVATGEEVAIVAGQVLAEPVEESVARLPRGRRPWVRMALLRTLVRSPRPRTQQELAVECGGTQVAVSQALRLLGAAVQRSGAGWVAADPGALWDRFLANYPGPGGLSTYWYGLAEPVRQAAAARGTAERQGVEVRLSGDVAADWWAPWRRPQGALLYGRRGVDLAAGVFSETSPSTATLRLVVPADGTVWATAAAWSSPEGDPLLTDPLLTAWDVLRAGGPDAAEAAGAVRDRVLGGVW